MTYTETISAYREPSFRAVRTRSLWQKSILHFKRLQGRDPLHVAIAEKKIYNARIILSDDCAEKDSEVAKVSLTITSLLLPLFNLNNNVVSIVVDYAAPILNSREQVYEVYCSDIFMLEKTSSQQMRFSAIEFSSLLCHFDNSSENNKIKKLILNSGAKSLTEDQLLSILTQLSQLSVRDNATLSAENTRISIE